MCMSRVVTGTHRPKGTERSSVLTEVRARRQKGQGQQRRLGAKLHFTSLQSTQGSSASKHQKMGVCAAQVLSPAALLEQRPVVIVDGLSTSSCHR